MRKHVELMRSVGVTDRVYETKLRRRENWKVSTHSSTPLQPSTSDAVYSSAMDIVAAASVT